MMKRLILILFAVALFGGLRAQDSVRISFQQPQMEDVLRVFEMNDTYLYRFDLQSLQKTHYNVTFYVDEYRYAEKQQRVHNFMLGPNILSLKDVPEEDWEYARREFGMAPDEYEFVSIPTVTLTFRMYRDSLSYISAATPKLGFMARPFKLEPVVPEEGGALYRYHAVPFRLVALPDADTVEMPLVFYGSAWYDTEFKVTRFCGETEIDPALQAEIVKHVPHAYVVGVKLEKIKEEDGAE